MGTNAHGRILLQKGARHTNTADRRDSPHNLGMSTTHDYRWCAAPRHNPHRDPMRDALGKRVVTFGL
jgi:hypothetical protein